MTRFRSAIYKVGALTVSLIFVAVSLEAILAVTHKGSKSYVRFVPDKGVTYVPNAFYRNSKEGASEGYFNSHGFRDYERTLRKPPNTFRILVLGDSYVQAMHVALSNSFPAILERELNQNSEKTKFEVLAMGMDGSGTAEEYMRYMNFGVDYSPDLVVLAFLTGNDFLDNSEFLSPGSHPFYFKFDGNHNLVLDRSVFDDYQKSLTLPKRLFQNLKQHSYLVNLLSEEIYLLKDAYRRRQYQKQFVAAEPAATKQAEHGKTLEELSLLNIYRPDPDEHWKEAYDITKGIILRFRSSVEAKGARFVLVSLSNAEQVHPEMQDELNRTYDIAFDYEMPDRMLEEFAKQNEISYLKLMPALREFHLKTGKYMHGFGAGHGGHWNENGHCLAAQKIFAYLGKSGLVPLDPARVDSAPVPCEMPRLH